VIAPTGLTEHLERPLARGHVPARAHTGAAGGAACGDLIRISLALDIVDPDNRISDAGFDASGCGAVVAAGSAVVGLVRNTPLLEAAKIAPETIAAELGGLMPAKRHAAELAADALHRALGAAVRNEARLASAGGSGRPGRTLVAMSGGVDSAVAALLVSRSGEEAIAVTLELWADPANDGERSCCSAQAVRGARLLAHGLGMPHISIDLREEFRAGVVDPWLEGYAAGDTPNPCVRCNGSVRIDAMLELADRLGAGRLATGHYARVCDDELAGGKRELDGGGEEPDGGERGLAGGEATHRGHLSHRSPLLRIAVDRRKDQSYALSALSPQSLARLQLPLGELTKPEVRALAAEAGLAVARRADSQDLCFLAGTGRDEFLSRHARIERKTGPIVDADGLVLGEHGGVHTVTVGQRRGLGDGPGLDARGQPLFVLRTDAVSNTITVGSRRELLTSTVRVRDVRLHRDACVVDAVKVRYRGERLPGRVAEPTRAGEHEAIELRLDEPAERTAPGQIACLYAGELIVGHGTIC
jgi:tRNA-uridine 2-sulfurtransferase